jgi:DNA replication and repair protein RecF
VQIGWVQLLEFRNYRTLQYSPTPALNLLTGPNAQGKTNLLEALGVLLTGRSFRTPRLAEIPRWGAETAAVAGEVRRSEGGRTVRRTIQRREDGAWARSGEDCPWARVVAFGWQDLAILNGGPAARRDFLDGFAARLYPTHRAALVRFRQILARRNHLLQQRLPEPALAAGLEPWDEQFVAVGVELIDRRQRAAAALQTEVARIYPELSGGRAASGGGRPKVEIRYRSSVGDVTDAAAFRATLDRRRREEARRGVSLAGPHRDDLTLELEGADARVFGSRGQQRLLALALRFAEVLPIREAVGTAPVLLLDDALSELDGRVRDNVLREIAAAEQVFLTSPEPVPARHGARWIVKEGDVTAA